MVIPDHIKNIAEAALNSYHKQKATGRVRLHFDVDIQDGKPVGITQDTGVAMRINCEETDIQRNGGTEHQE